MKKINGTNEAVENVMNVVSNEIVKSGKSGVSLQSEAVKPSRKDSRSRFIAFIRNREEIGLNKFFKLFEAFRSDDKDGYTDYLISRNMDIHVEYTFKWFSENCPFVVDANGKKEFAKWRKVSGRYPESDTPEYNREMKTGVKYTLVPYRCYRANWEQYESMLNDVVANMKRIKREAEAAKKAAEAEANKAKAEKTKSDRIAKLEAELKKLKAD